MEIYQPSWRGKNIISKKGADGKKYITMLGPQALMYVPITVVPNSKYQISIEACRRSGNGIIFCNIYGNKNFDFVQRQIGCESSQWITYDIELSVGDFPKTQPMVLRLWRENNGTGEVSIRKINVCIIDSDEIETLDTKLTKKQSLRFQSQRQQPATSAKRRRRNLVRHHPKQPKKIINEEQFVRILKPEKNNGIKVLYLPLNGFIRQDIYEKGFMENGFTTCCFDYVPYHRICGNLEKKIMELVESFKPDWIHLNAQFVPIIKPSTIQTIKQLYPSIKISDWTGDIRSHAVKCFVNISRHTDVSFISSEGQIDLYKRDFNDIQFLQTGYNNNDFYSIDEKEYKYDIVFCGTNSDKKRNFPGTQFRFQLVEALKNHFGNRFSLFGKNWPKAFNSLGTIPHSEQNQIYNSSRIILSINQFNNVYKYFSGRQFIAMTSGNLVVSHFVPGIDEYFEDGTHVVFFRTKDECINKIEYYLEHPDLAKSIGEMGALKIRENNTFFHHVKELASKMGFQTINNKTFTEKIRKSLIESDNGNEKIVTLSNGLTEIKQTTKIDDKKIFEYNPHFIISNRKITNNIKNDFVNKIVSTKRTNHRYYFLGEYGYCIRQLFPFLETYQGEKLTILTWDNVVNMAELLFGDKFVYVNASEYIKKPDENLRICTLYKDDYIIEQIENNGFSHIKELSNRFYDGGFTEFYPVKTKLECGELKTEKPYISVFPRKRQIGLKRNIFTSSHLDFLQENFPHKKIMGHGFPDERVEFDIEYCKDIYEQINVLNNSVFLVSPRSGMMDIALMCGCDIVCLSKQLHHFLKKEINTHNCRILQWENFKKQCK